MRTTIQMDPPMTPPFNEYTLLADITDKWGHYGAHADCCRWMIDEICRLRAATEHATDALTNAQNRIALLRSAGASLAEHMRSGSDIGWDAAIDHWDDTCRG